MAAPPETAINEKLKLSYSAELCKEYERSLKGRTCFIGVSLMEQADKHQLHNPTILRGIYE